MKQVIKTTEDVVLYEGDHETRWKAVEAAIAAGLMLQKVDLHGDDLRHVDLSYVDMSWANLVGADLRGANLNQTDLLHADLRKAHVTSMKQLDQAYRIGADWRGVIIEVTAPVKAKRRFMLGASLEKSKCLGEDWAFIDSLLLTGLVIVVGLMALSKGYDPATSISRVGTVLFIPTFASMVWAWSRLAIWEGKPNPYFYYFVGPITLVRWLFVLLYHLLSRVEGEALADKSADYQILREFLKTQTELQDTYDRLQSELGKTVEVLGALVRLNQPAAKPLIDKLQGQEIELQRLATKAVEALEKVGADIRGIEHKFNELDQIRTALAAMNQADTNDYLIACSEEIVKDAMALHMARQGALDEITGAMLVLDNPELPGRMILEEQELMEATR